MTKNGHKLDLLSVRNPLIQVFNLYEEKLLREYTTKEYATSMMVWRGGKTHSCILEAADRMVQELQFCSVLHIQTCHIHCYIGWKIVKGALQ